jgi:UDP-glucose 4-epimerase
MKTSLVSGGAGFIGSHVADELLAMGHQVIVLDDLSGGFLENVPAHAQFVRGSIVDHHLVDSLFESYRFTFVFHLGAYAAEGLSHFIKRFNYTNNLIGSVNLINAAVNSGTVQCFVFTSSIAVYGRNQLPMTEDLIPRPEDPYGIAKYAVEQDLHQARDMFGLPFIIFRPHNVYGERQNIGDRYRNVIGIFMNQAMKGEPFTIFGDGTQTRAFSHVDDVAPIIARAAERPETYNTVYNVGADTPCSVNKLARVVAEAMGVPLRVRYLDARHEVLHAFSSHERAQQAFGDLFRNVPLEAGVRRMAQWSRQHGSRETKPFTSIEVARHMPPSWAAFHQDTGKEQERER